MIYYIGKQKDCPWFTHGTMSDCISYLQTQNVIGLDIETTQKFNGKYSDHLEGLDPHLTKIVMLQVGTEERQYVIDVRAVSINSLRSILENKKITKVGHNLKFEYKHLKKYGIEIAGLYDTQIAEKVLYTGLLTDYVSLNSLNKKYLDFTVDKDIRLEFKKIFNRPFTYDQIKYGAGDITSPLQIREKQLPLIEERKVENCIALEMLFIPVLGDIEFVGMHLDKEKWTQLYEDNREGLKAAEEELNKYVLENYPWTRFVSHQLGFFGEGPSCVIKWSSSAQVIKFFRHLAICPQKQKPDGKYGWTVEAKTLLASLTTINKNIEDKERELIYKYLEYKGFVKATTTYGLDYFKHINPITGRIHTNYDQIISTGRISSSSPNLQQIPSNVRFRQCFTAPEGFKIVNADYSGQEQIILANKSNDPELQEFYKKDLGDMHSFVAQKIFPELQELTLDEIKTNHKDKRQIAKAAGFAINYGGTGYTIADNLGISQAEGDEVYEKYFQAFPNLKKYFDMVQRAAHQRGYILIDPLTGRKYWFKHPKDKKERHKIDKWALNYPIQGEAGGITKYAPILYRRWIRSQGLQDKIFITNLIHDEINVEAHESVVDLAAENLERCMKESADRWCKEIPLRATAVIGDYWGH